MNLHCVVNPMRKHSQLIPVRLAARLIIIIGTLLVVAVYKFLGLGDISVPKPREWKPGTVFRGMATVIDGDSLKINGMDVRLYAIDAPEGRQQCQDGHGKTFSCGEVAAVKLKALVVGGEVVCTEQNVDQYGRIAAICTKQNMDINERLVMMGWALAYRHHSDTYVPAEKHAKNNNNGLWSGNFENPRDWRRRQPEKQ